MSLAAPSPPLRELTGAQRRWIAGGYTSMLGSLAGQTLFIALFGAAIRGEFGMTDGQYGLLYTAATLVSAVLLVFAGTLADKVPASVLGMALCAGLAAMSLLMALADGLVALFLALLGLRFFGQGMMTHNAATAMTRWFNRYRGRALALSNLGLNTGESVLPVLVALGIAAIGWRNVWLVTALIVLLVLLPAIGFLFSGPPDGKRARAKGTLNPDAGADTPTGAQWTRSRVLRDPLFWAVIAGALAMPAFSTAIFFHQTNLVASKGWDLLVFASFFPVMSVSAVGSSLVAGLAVDRYGATRVLPLVPVPLGLASLVLFLVPGTLAIPAFFLLAGMSNGMFGSVVNALWAELYGTARLGSIRAVVTSLIVLASAVGPGIVGLAIDAGLPVDAQAIAFALYCFATALLAFSLRRRFVDRAAALADETGATGPAA